MHTSQTIMLMADLGELIKNRRLGRRWSLRRLAESIGVTPAYVADIEAGRRLPSAELTERISAALEISSDELAEADNRLPPEMREWIEERPQLLNLLRSLRGSPESDMLIQRLTRFINRRLPPKTPRGFVVIWESELRAIAAEASAWSIETGGDLFGRWLDIPAIFLATKAGPNAQRNNAHFRLDVDYLRQLSETLAMDWALRYFGDWHSHHRLGLSAPSNGDQKRIRSIAGRNEFTGMIEIIVTLEDTRSEPTIRIHPWIYDLSSEMSGPFPLRVKVLPGMSPIRQALISRRALPEQDLTGWERISWNRIRIGADNAPPVLEPSSDVDTTTREKALSQLVEALKSASRSPVERHSTGFGSIIVAKLTPPHYLAFALGTAWPMSVLDIHLLNRNDGSTVPLDTPPGLTAPNIQGILDVFHSTKSKEERTA